MDEEMDEEYACEMLRALAEENQTRKILLMLKESKNLEDLEAKLKALLNK